MRNPYKRTDVYVCNYETHAKFANKVSVYHVQYVKKCYSQGCIIFKWFCALLNKGKKCVRGYQYIGRLCQGCVHYSDEKIHYQPQIALSAIEFENFGEEVEEFDEWLSGVRNSTVTFWGEVDSIKPRFKKVISGGGGQIRLNGYLLIFKRGFIGAKSLDDYFYARISPFQQERLSFARGDQFEAKGHLTFDRGRIIMSKMWNLEFDSRSGKETWNNSEALVARESATLISTQPESCLHCSRGALVDEVEKKNGQTIMRRELYCLEGIADPQLCYVNAVEKIDQCA